MMASIQDTVIKIEDLCRTCLTKENEFQSLFDVFIGGVPLSCVVTSVTGLKISRNDGLPSVICCECKDKAQKAFDFKKKSEVSHLTLKSLFKKERKCFSYSTKYCNQTSTSIKTEDSLTNDDDDDYMDNDVSIPINYEPEIGNNVEVKYSLLPIQVEGHTSETTHVKNSVKQSKVEVDCVFDNKTYSTILKPVTKSEIDQDKPKRYIKVECEESSSNYSVSLCPLCGMCYDDTKETLSSHMFKYHSDVMGIKKRGRPKKILAATILNKLSTNGFCITPLSKPKVECVLCKQSFETKVALDNHIASHKDQKVLSCVICKKMYTDKDNYDVHSCNDGKSKELGDNEETSSDTKKLSQFLSEISLQEILDTTNVAFPDVNSIQICSVCTRVLVTEDELNSHHDAEHPELSRRCNLCSKIFATTRSAARHRSLCKQVERKFRCSTCGLKFAYEISLNKHILRYHEGQSVSVKFIDPKTKMENRQFQCDTCNRCFHKREQLVKHTKVHMPSEKFYQCDVCQKKFNRRDNLRSHQRVHDTHRDKTPSKSCLCLYCGRSFSNSSNMIVHMRRHTGEKPYKCDFCGKGFPRSSDLQCHRRSHTGEKPCVCRVCGKGFSRSNKLSRHMRVHTGQRPYKCTYCDKAFSQSNDLTLHIRRHTGDRPYICEICGDRFIQGTALQNHRRAHGHFPPLSTETPTVQNISFTVQPTNLNID